MTRKRIHRYATLIALALWTILAIDYSVPGPLDRLGKAKGTDFLQFYVAGSFAREGRPERFYDLDAEHARGREVAPTVKDTVYVPVQSPQTALVFAPLTAVSYPTALTIWMVVVAA